MRKAITRFTASLIVLSITIVAILHFSSGKDTLAASGDTYPDQLSTATFTGFDGTTQSCYVLAPNGNGTYKPVILFPGLGTYDGYRYQFPSHANKWSASGLIDDYVYIIPIFNSQDASCSPITDNAFCAYSNRHAAAHMDESYFGDLLDAIQAGQISSKVDTTADISVAGYSMGGCAALFAGCEYYDRVVNVGGLSSSWMFYNPQGGWILDSELDTRLHYSDSPNAHRLICASWTEQDGTRFGDLYRYMNLFRDRGIYFKVKDFQTGDHNMTFFLKEIFMFLYYIENDSVADIDSIYSQAESYSTTPTTTTTTTTTSATAAPSATTVAPSSTASSSEAPVSTTTAPATTTAATAAPTTDTTAAPAETTSVPTPVAPPPSSEVLSVTNSLVSVNYSTHVQNIGWQPYVADGVMAGTEGQSLRLEAMAVNISSDMDLGVRYCTHVQNIGWQDWVYDGAAAGTEGLSYRLEGMKIELTGSAAADYDIYYRVHVQNIGWMDWVSNGQTAGTEGQSLRLEGLQIKVLPKGTSPDIISYNTHVENIGWQPYVTDGVMAGTTGQSLRLEGIHIDVTGLEGVGVEYRTHIQNIGWEECWTADGGFSGTEGQSLRLEAIEIRLTGENASQYDIYYRVHVQNFGWTGWASNGASCGSAGYSYRLEGIEIMVVPAGSPAPGSTENCFYQM
ncbi:Uncharacterized conserved protein YjdB, contains Ig-like domain [Oscillospiraceae bacterium]|nr:Uncharacterized conserved protein YjdB, contains Ig-like domain [Oscillospiraceae bacterium]